MTRMRRRLTMDLMEKMIAEGEGWILSHRFVNVVDDDYAWFLIIVPSYEELYLFGHIAAEGLCHVDVYNGVTEVTKSNHVTFRNKLMNHSTTIHTVVYRTMTISNDGAPVMQGICPANQVVPIIGVSEAIKDFIILSGGKHLIKVRNKSGGPIDIALNFSVMKFAA